MYFSNATFALVSLLRLLRFVDGISIIVLFWEQTITSILFV